MYIAGRKRTASRPPRTLIDFASYLWPPCGVPTTFSFSPMFSPGAATSRVHLRRWTNSGQFRVRVRAQNSFCVKQGRRSEEHTSELQSPCNLVCRLLLEKKQY